MQNRISAVIAVVLLITGCVSAEPAKAPDAGEPYRIAYEAGLSAEKQADYRTAQQAYARALKLAEEQKLGAAAESAATYELGRVTGYLCDFDRAHRLLRQSLEIEQRVSGAYSANVSARYVELARLNYDNGRFADAIPYYERAIPILERLDVDKRNPLAFADVLEEFGAALRHKQAAREAASYLQRAELLRAQYANRAREFIPVRYNRNCSRQ